MADLTSKLEPATFNIVSTETSKPVSNNEALLISAAISLKRIADAVETLASAVDYRYGEPSIRTRHET
jgi:hypothetical protein